jgi:hypothetical protein
MSSGKQQEKIGGWAIINNRKNRIRRSDKQQEIIGG